MCPRSCARANQSTSSAGETSARSSPTSSNSVGRAASASITRTGRGPSSSSGRKPGGGSPSRKNSAWQTQAIGARERRELQLELAREPEVVVGEEGDGVAARGADAGVVGVGERVALLLEHARAVALGDRAGGVARAAVDEQHLERRGRSARATLASASAR